MANSTDEKRAPKKDLRARDAREASDRTQPVVKPARRRANEITSALGLTPIRGRSGPRLAY